MHSTPKVGQNSEGYDIIPAVKPWRTSTALPQGDSSHAAAPGRGPVVRGPGYRGPGCGRQRKRKFERRNAAACRPAVKVCWAACRLTDWQAAVTSAEAGRRARASCPRRCCGSHNAAKAAAVSSPPSHACREQEDIVTAGGNEKLAYHLDT